MQLDKYGICHVDKIDKLFFFVGKKSNEWISCAQVGGDKMAAEEDFLWEDDLMTRSLQRQNSHLAKLGQW